MPGCPPFCQERAEAATQWKEFTAPDGKRYYYNKDTKESRWTIPDELKRAREAAGERAQRWDGVGVGLPERCVCSGGKTLEGAALCMVACCTAGAAHVP